MCLGTTEEKWSGSSIACFDLEGQPSVTWSVPLCILVARELLVVMRVLAHSFSSGPLKAARGSEHKLLARPPAFAISVLKMGSENGLSQT